MKLKVLMVAAAAVLAGTAVAGAQSDNPPGAKFQTEKQRAANGLPEKPSQVRRHVRVKHHPRHMTTMGMRSSRSGY
jgi:hypothetical protein